MGVLPSLTLSSRLAACIGMCFLVNGGIVDRMENTFLVLVAFGLFHLLLARDACA